MADGVKPPGRRWPHFVEPRPAAPAPGQPDKYRSQRVEHWRSGTFSPSEHRIIDRFARDVLAGRLPDALAASAGCLAAILGRRRRTHGARPLSFHTVHVHLLHRLRERRMVRPKARFCPDELAVVERFARAAMDGKYASPHRAVPDCLKALARLYRRLGVGATFSREPGAVRARLTAAALRLGYNSAYRFWTKAELAAVDEGLAGVCQGRFKSVDAAAEAVTRLLERDFRARKKAGVEPAGATPRRLPGVKMLMTARYARLKLPRVHCPWTEAEQAVALKYARAVDSGRYRSWRRAAVFCKAELDRLAVAAGRDTPLGRLRLAGRDVHSIHDKVIEVAHYHGLKGPEHRFWTDEESRIFRDWFRWYERRRLARGRGPIVAATEGLVDELAEKGHRRTNRACRTRFKDEWNRRHPER